MHGIYTQPGAKGIAGLLQEEAWTGVKVTQMLDFTPTATWAHITRYLPFTEYQKLRPLGVRLELSVPLIPDDGSTLALGAAGAYDQHWTALATNLVKYDLADSVIRLGWEMNGGWYKWTARDGKAADYAGAFRSAVTAMRAVPGAAFVFDWCVANAVTPQLFVNGAVDTIYPGDAYVDVIGVDVYDGAYAFYPTPADPVAATTAHTNSFKFQYGGGFALTSTVNASPVGLRYWSDLARLHGKPLAIDEWGVTWQSDGHGGDDNPMFVDQMFNFINDPWNNVAWAAYFSIDTATRKHALNSPTTLFPKSAERYLTRIGTTH